MTSTTYIIYFLTVFITAIAWLELSWTYLLYFVVVNSYFTLGEYLIHRFVFHHLSPRAHQKHHDDPTKFSRLFIPIPVTLVNNGILFLIAKDNVYMIMSAAHLSYLLFEWAHYASHYPMTQLILPSRLISFHHSHHTNNTHNFGFTTPFWDIVFGTSSAQFKWSDYPLSCLPISVLSFIRL